MICKLWSSYLSPSVLKASFPHTRYYHDYSNPLHIQKQHVFPIYLLTWLHKITLHHENMISYEMITKSFTTILFTLVWWQVWNNDSYQILTKGSPWWNMSDHHRYYSGIKEYWSSIWYDIALKTESRHNDNIVITQVVIMMTTCRDHSDAKLVLRQFSILDITHGLVNIRITIAIHCHSQRFLGSESLLYYRVLNTLVRVTVHNTRPVILNNE